MKQPSPVELEIINLARENASVKKYTLKKIGELASSSFGRPVPYTHEFVRQTLNKWDGHAGFQYKPRVTTEKNLAIQSSKNKMTERRNLFIKLWNSGENWAVISDRLGITPFHVFSKATELRKRGYELKYRNG